MRLTMVGCSGSMPGPHSAASCYLLEADGFRLVVDLGNGAVGALQRYTALNQVDAVALSHLHADHCIDMCPLWIARKYSDEDPLRPIPDLPPNLHLCGRQAGEHAARAGAGRLILTHLAPDIDPARSLAAAAETFGGTVAQLILTTWPPFLHSCGLSPLAGAMLQFDT
jgi:ribonuclease BN (tRNA processing enzyme)